MEYIKMSIERYEKLKDLENENKKLIRGLKSFRLKGADLYLQEPVQRMYFLESDAIKELITTIKMQQKVIMEKNRKIIKLEEENYNLSGRVMHLRLEKESKKIKRWYSWTKF